MRTAISLWPRPRSTWITGCLLTAIGASVLLLPTTARGGDTEPFPVDVWESPLSEPRQHVRKAYAPLAHATKQWHVCASIPHLKDDYWLAVNFALIQEARRLGVRLDLFEAGGYQHLQTQKEQISKCVEGGAHGLIVGAISADGLNDLIASYADRRIPVVDLINGVGSEEVAARVGADFYDMGQAAGEYLKKLTERTGMPIRIAWFPGPQGAGWVSAGDQGLRDALKGTRITIVETHFGDTGIAEQTRLLNATFDRRKEIDYVVGTAVTAEAAVRVLRERRLSDRIKVLSYYFGPGVYRGIQRRTIVAAPTDQPALQSKLAVDLVVRILEKKSYPRRVSAPVLLIDGDSVNRFDVTYSLAPPGFRRIFSTTN
jgi:periplasmic protein TorT